MTRPGFIGRQRERLALGGVRALLGPGEQVLGWGHVQDPDGRRHGILALTSARCVVHWIARDLDDVVLAWGDVHAWDVQPADRGGPVLTIQGTTGKVAVRLPVSSRARARNGSSLLGLVAELAPADAHPSQRPPAETGFALRAERRGLRGHTRRVLVTIAGILLVLLGLLFASPFLPGPGMLTILAGLALLAREYDWAREVYSWVKGRVERFWERRRARKARRRAEPSRELQDA